VLCNSLSSGIYYTVYRTSYVFIWVGVFGDVWIMGSFLEKVRQVRNILGRGGEKAKLRKLEKLVREEQKLLAQIDPKLAKKINKVAQKIANLKAK